MHLPLRLVLACACTLGAGVLAHAGEPAGRAVVHPLPGMEIGYQTLAPDATTAGPGRLDGSLALPTGTLRTAVRLEPTGEQRLKWGDTSFELPAPGVPGQLQLRGLENGGTAAVWRGPLVGRLGAETQADRTPVRTGHALQLRQEFDDGDAARASLQVSNTAAAEGARWELEWAENAGPSRWTVGLDGAQRDYVPAHGGSEARTGLRLGTQWRLTPEMRLDVQFARQVRWQAEPATALKVGTQFALPRRASLATGMELDGASGPRASLMLKVPVEAR